VLEEEGAGDAVGAGRRAGAAPQWLRGPSSSSSRPLHVRAAEGLAPPRQCSGERRLPQQGALAPERSFRMILAAGSDLTLAGGGAKRPSGGLAMCVCVFELSGTIRRWAGRHVIGTAPRMARGRSRAALSAPSPASLVNSFALPKLLIGCPPAHPFIAGGCTDSRGSHSHFKASPVRLHLLVPARGSANDGL